MLIADEGLADEKGVPLWLAARKAARESDWHENLHDVVRDRGGMKARHVRFELPGALIVLLETVDGGLCPSGFDPAGEEQHVGRLPEHGFDRVCVMRILRSHEFREEIAHFARI